MVVPSLQWTLVGLPKERKHSCGVGTQTRGSLTADFRRGGAHSESNSFRVGLWAVLEGHRDLQLVEWSAGGGELDPRRVWVMIERDRDLLQPCRGLRVNYFEADWSRRASVLTMGTTVAQRTLHRLERDRIDPVIVLQANSKIH